MEAKRTPICRHCACPLMLLKKANGKEEQRRVCARCIEIWRGNPKTSEKKRAQVRAWHAANRDKVKAINDAWRAANKDHASLTRRKLLIEDAELVSDVATVYYRRKREQS